MTPKEFYQEQLVKHQKTRSELMSKMRLLQIVRLIVFLAAIAGVYLFWGSRYGVLLTLVVGIVGFVFLVFQHTNVKAKKRKSQALIEINKIELRVLDRDVDGLPTGDQFKNDQHAYSQDLDLFGKASFYQYLNRTQLDEGSQTLVNILLANDPSNILEKQEAIKELASKPEWRQSFSAEGSLLKTKVSTKAVRSWFLNYVPFVPRITKILVPIIGVLSLAAITLYLLDIIAGMHLMLWFFVGGSIIGRYLKKIGKLASDLGEIHDTFIRYSSLLGHIEGEEFRSAILAKWQEKVTRDTIKASELLNEFSKLTTALDQRNNVFMSIPANGFFLRDFHLARKIERWIEANKAKAEDWFHIVAEFDALNSLGNYAYNHSTYTYPLLAESNEQVDAKNLGHPLLQAKGRIDNDYKIDVEQFFIITGANMAGKSTFLRTVALSIVMANSGLPVCAESYKYKPIKLITSMRTTDSLSENESYFFSELKRLKIIIDTIQTDDHFIILDEILKGTNSKDKAEGSQQFVQKLVKSKSTGIIATHDLSLCTLEDSLDEVRNYYFDAEIVNDELYFDYSLKKGICQNMNASFLLKKMEII